MTDKSNTAPGEDPKWAQLESSMTSASAEAKPAATQPIQTDEEQQRIAESSAKADQVAGDLFTKLGINRKVESSAASVAAEPPLGNGSVQTTIPGAGRVDFDLGSGSNPPPPPLPPSGGGGSGSASSPEPSWFDKLLAFMQSTAGKVFGVTVIIYIAISWISATITSPERLQAMEKLAEINRKQKELELKEKELDAKTQPGSNQAVGAQSPQASGCTAHNGNGTPQMLSSCKMVTDVTSTHGKASLSQYVIQGNLERVNGEYELRDPRNPSQVLCQTHLPGSYKYSANGCAEELRTLSYPLELRFVRYSNITYIFR